MKHIGIVTKDRRVFDGFISVDLNDNPKDKKYIQLDSYFKVQGREFEKIYFMVYKLPHISHVRELQLFAEFREIETEKIY